MYTRPTLSSFFLFCFALQCIYGGIVAFAFDERLESRATVSDFPSIVCNFDTHLVHRSLYKRGIQKGSLQGALTAYEVFSSTFSWLF